MLSHRRILTVMITALLLLATIACQPPAGPSGNALNALESDFSDAPVAAGAEEEPGDGGGDFGAADSVDDPFRLVAPALQGIGFESHSATCDPFDEAYEH